ncbi:MAG: hypothetical protein HYT48_00280 [Candidatus Vogelbacteria bacterium]|nr:hypothetical protein [Candidatus Vogelbacteria bacterium]
MVLTTLAPQFLLSPCDFGERVEIGRQISVPGFELNYGAGSDGCGESYGTLRLIMSERFDRQTQFFTVDPANTSEWTWHIMVWGTLGAPGRPLEFRDSLRLFRREVELAQSFRVVSDPSGFSYLAGLWAMPAMVEGVEMSYREFADFALPPARWFTLDLTLSGSFGSDALADWRGAAFVPEPSSLWLVLVLVCLWRR